MKIIDSIRDIAHPDNWCSKCEPSHILMNKETERLMYLDGSFPKGENFTDSIIVDGKTYTLIITHTTNLLVLGF